MNEKEYDELQNRKEEIENRQKQIEKKREETLEKLRELEKEEESISNKIQELGEKRDELYRKNVEKLIHEYIDILREHDNIFNYIISMDELTELLLNGESTDTNQDGTLFKYDEDEYEKLMEKYESVKKVGEYAKLDFGLMNEKLRIIGNIMDNMDTLSLEDDWRK